MQNYTVPAGIPCRFSVDEDAVKFLAADPRDLDLAKRIMPGLELAPDEGPNHYSDGENVYYSIEADVEKQGRTIRPDDEETILKPAWVRYSYRTISGGHWEPDDVDVHYPDDSKVAYPSLFAAVAETRHDQLDAEFEHTDNHCYSCDGTGTNDPLADEVKYECKSCGGKGWKGQDEK